MWGNRHNLARQCAWQWLALLAAAYLAGCDRGTSPATTTQPADAVAATRPFVLSGRTPFTGTIRTKKLAGPVTLADVTYTIDGAAGRIRRDEVDFSDVVTEHLAGNEPRSGVIVDLPARHVVLYATYLDRRHRVDLTLEEYDRTLKNELTGYAGQVSQRHGFGTTFLPLGDVERFGQYTATNHANAATVNGLACDRLVLHPPPLSAEVEHCRAVVVDRSLVERVEPGLPAEVTGFPLRIRVNAPAAEVAGIWQSVERDVTRRRQPSRVEQIAGKALRATTKAATQVARVIEVTYEAADITEAPLPADAFAPPDGFAPCASYAEFVEKTSVGGSGGGGFDFD